VLYAMLFRSSYAIWGRTIMPPSRSFRSTARWGSLLRTAIVVAALTAPSSLAAQTSQPEASQSTTATSSLQMMTVQEKQGYGCLWAGAMGAVAAYVYSDIIAIAVSGTVAPGLLIPVLASGFAVACGVGSQATPAVLHMLGTE
jgi:hypothetical protein